MSFKEKVQHFRLTIIPSDSFQQIDHRNHNSNFREKDVVNKQNGQINFDETPENPENDRRCLEFRVLDACLKGFKDVIDDYLDCEYFQIILKIQFILSYNKQIFSTIF